MTVAVNSLDSGSTTFIFLRENTPERFAGVPGSSHSPPTLMAVIGIAGWRYVRAKRTARRRELTAENLKIKQRFSDAQNILGFLVLHKTSGLPVYSSH